MARNHGVPPVCEAWLEHGDDQEAVTHGLARTGRAITSACRQAERRPEPVRVP